MLTIKNYFSIEMSRIIMDELSQNCNLLHDKAEYNKFRMNDDQNAIFN